MSAATAARLIHMANQIAAFFASQPAATRAAQVAEHIETYWPPPMRLAIRDHLSGGGDGLSDLAREGVAHLRGVKARSPA